MTKAIKPSHATWASDGTVKLHVKAILRKLEVHSRVEAAVMAVEYGMSHQTNKQ